MTSNFHLTIEGLNRELICSRDRTLLQTLTENGIVFTADCGGKGTCGKCGVKVLSGQLSDAAAAALKPEPDGTYPACKSYPAEDITLFLPPMDTGAKGAIAENETYENLPGLSIVTKQVITPVFPTLENNYSLQEMIAKALDKPEVILNNSNILRELALILNQGAKTLTVTLFDREVIAIEAGNTGNALFGVAFDIGTTTVAGMLVDLTAKKILATYSETNPQTTFGADVISRIQAAGVKDGLTLLSEAIRRSLNRITAELCRNTGVNPAQIYAACLAGNTTMSHLLLNISPAALTRLPYAQVFRTTALLQPAEIGLEINPDGRIIVLPNIASFIGSDTTAAIVSIDQDILPTPRLLVDLGTNGEMALNYGQEIYVCSTAAGPAFEGAHIKNGMRAFAGAVSEVTAADGEIAVKVIGGVKPVGICGSGAVMAVAELLKAGVIDPSGRFNAPAELPQKLRRRLRKEKDQGWLFTLCRAEDTANGTEICLTQSDIRQIQLVKSAILTGIEFLLERLPEDTAVDVFLAGAFGNYIDIESAKVIGLLPKTRVKTVRSVGNAAGTGAVEALLFASKFKRCANLFNSVKYIELASQPDFQDRFVDNLSFD